MVALAAGNTSNEWPQVSSADNTVTSFANPAHRPYTFDLNSIVPGRSYRRLKATRFQDSVANNGESVSGEVTLGERDALFLVQTAEAAAEMRSVERIEAGWRFLHPGR